MVDNYWDEKEASIELPFQIDKPLVFLDIEATGPDPQLDRIIEIHCIRFEPDQSKKIFYSMVNPGEKIPMESTRIHGFTNKDLSQSPGFKKIASDLYHILDGADIGGYNVMRFDLRILFNEFKRVDVNFQLDEIRVLDPFQIFVKKHKRDLSSAYEFYCDKELKDAHGAKADNIAALEVFLSQLNKYEDLPSGVEELSEFCLDPGDGYLDPERFLAWKNDQAIVNFGKHKGKLLRDVVKEDYNFLFWVTKNNFNPPLIRIIKRALKGEIPEKPKSEQ